MRRILVSQTAHILYVLPTSAWWQQSKLSKLGVIQAVYGGICLLEDLCALPVNELMIIYRNCFTYSLNQALESEVCDSVEMV